LCNNCGGSGGTALYSASDFDTGLNEHQLVMCNNCGIVATMGVTDDVLSEAYSTQYYGSGERKFSGFFEYWLTLGYRLRAKRIRAEWRAGHPTDAGPSVLDIGCGRGTLLKEFKTLGAQILGLERPEFPLTKECARFVSVGSLGEQRFDGVKFDIIIIWHVLEHMFEVDEMLKDIANHLSETGLLVIAVPNFDSCQQRLFSRHWFHLDIPRHLTHLDQKWLGDCLNRHGLEEKFCSTFDVTQNTYGFVQSTLNMMFPKYPNALYRLLKYQTGERHWMQLAAWSAAAALLFLPACIEALTSAFRGQGATLTMYAGYCLKE